MPPNKTGTRDLPATGSRRSAARERILETADRLFYSEGIHSVGVNRLVEESAVTRVTFYRHFLSKDDLIAGYLEDRARRARHRITQVIEDGHGDAGAVLRELGRVFTSETFAGEYRGCPFINASAEFAAPGHPARVLATAQRAWIADTIERLLRDMGHRAPARTARQLLMLQTGAIFGVAIDDTPGLDTAFLDAWDRLIGS
ncbi:MAG: TetR/AcrR family transcriptional regulator, partial [Streptosporangiaceae bacterium]|nr:TetR/AcrR family transcriptional regulator [Streptosporangiaceae bacterium]